MFYGLCFLALYILFNAYMCFLSFTNFNLHGSALYTVCHKGFIDVLQLVCALEPIQGPRRSGGSLEPGACRRCSSEKENTGSSTVHRALISRTKSYIVYIAIPERVVRSINACAVVCTDTLSTLRPGSARHSGQIGCGGPGRGGTAERPAASRQGGAQLLTCEDASDADCDDGGPSPAQITRSAPTAPTAMT